MSNRDAPGQLHLPCCTEERDEIHKLAAKMKRHHQERGSRPDTLKALRRVFRILESRGMRTVAELADETLDRRFGEWTASEGLADSTRDLLRGHLHAIIRCAHKWGLLPCQPTLPSRVKPGGRQWRLEHSPSTRTLPPHPDVVRSVLEHFHARKDTWKGFRSYAFLMTVAWTRLPLRSVLRLRRDNILLGKGDVDLWPTPVFRFRPRNGQVQCLPIPASLVTVLDEWIDKNRSPWWVFPGLTKEAPWSLKSSHSETPSSVLKAACRALGIEPFTCEQLRGSLASPEFKATGTAPPQPEDSEKATPLDEIAYADKLRALNFGLEADFVRHFHGRTSSTWPEIVEAVCPGEERDWATVKTWVNRVKNALREVDPSCSLSFGTRHRGYRVVKHSTPSEPS